MTVEVIERNFRPGAAASVLATGAVEWGGLDSADAAVDETVVVLRGDVDAAHIAAVHEQAFGFKARHLYRPIRGYAAQLSANQIGAVSRLPEVQYVVRSSTGAAPRPVALTAAEFPQILTQGIRRIGGAESSTASGNNTGAVDIAVAVVDGGIQPDHPDLNVVGGVNCVGDGRPDEWGDRDGHGTMVAGLIAARDNDVGIVGVAPGARLFAVRVANSAGFITDADLLCAVDWIAGARRDGRTPRPSSLLATSPRRSATSARRTTRRCSLPQRSATPTGCRAVLVPRTAASRNSATTPRPSSATSPPTRSIRRTSLLRPGSA